MLQYETSLDNAFAALADPTRRALVARLCEAELSVGALAEPLAMSLSAVGQHLRVLETSGLVITEKRGRTRYCRVDEARLGAVENWLRDRRHHAERRLDRLERHVSRDGARDGN